MQTHYSPITKSGWFYLWLCLVTVALFVNHSNWLKKVELANLKVWNNVFSEEIVPAKLARVVDIDFDQRGFNRIQKLAKQHPNAVFGFIGNYSQEFLDKVSNHKLDNHPINAVFYSRNHSSVSQLKNFNNQFVYFIPHAEKISWMTSASHKFSVQPNILENEFYTLWRDGEQLYPTFISQLIIQSLTKSSKVVPSVSLEIFLENNLVVDEKKHVFSFDASIYLLANSNNASTFENVLEMDSDLTFILVDDLSFAEGEIIENSLDNILTGSYLVKNGFSILLNGITLLIFLFVVLKMGRLILRSQTIIVVVLIILIVSIQLVFIKFSLWFPIHLIILLILTSWIVQICYWKEQNYFAEWSSRGDNEGIQEINLVASSKPDLQKNSLATLEQTEEDVLQQTLIIEKNNTAGRLLNNTLLKVENFGRYQVEGILGKGAMGVVYQGVDPKIHRHVAIKTLQLSEDLDDRSLKDNKERFFREAETAGNLSHANIVTIYDVGEQLHANTNSLLGYIAMDLLTGAPLSEYVHEDKLLPSVLVFQLMIQMADALDYAHQKNVIHRDIKPANIIYDDEIQRGTLTDFGIAYMSDHSKTKTGTIMGSPYYMSPEQVIGKKVDARSDIFSLGVTFYQLLSGHLPFVGESIATVAYHITKTKHKSVSHWNNKLPSSATRICNKAMQKDVNKRYQDMQQFKQALINALKRDFKKLPLS